MKTETVFELPFDFPVEIRKLPRKGQNVSYAADADAMNKIAAAYDLIEICDFTAKANLAPWKRDGIKISGAVTASIRQPCAVSGEAISATVDEPVDIVYVPEGSKLAKPKTNDDGEWVFDIEGEEIPETFSGDSINLAEVWLEFFSMGIDPFAKKEGAVFQAGENPTEADEKQSPFAILSQLKS